MVQWFSQLHLWSLPFGVRAGFWDFPNCLAGLVCEEDSPYEFSRSKLMEGGPDTLFRAVFRDCRKGMAAIRSSPTSASRMQTRVWVPGQARNDGGG